MSNINSDEGNFFVLSYQIQIMSEVINLTLTYILYGCQLSWMHSCLILH